MLINIEEPSAHKISSTSEIAIGIDLGTTNSVAAIYRNGAPELLQDDSGKLFIPSIVELDDSTLRSTKRLMNDPLKEIHGSHTPLSCAINILKNLKQRAENALKSPVSKAVITVPAYFDETARQATKDAAYLADLEVIRLINEPTAAALAYGLDQGSEGIFVVYDLGGGTFDVSILNFRKGVFQVLATSGDTNLGGDDIDHAINNYFNWDDPLKARQAKENLEFGLSEDLLFELSEPYISKTIEICAETLVDAKLSIADIKGVILVGGSTRLQSVRTHVEEFFKQKPLTNLDPDYVVAYGASLQAYQLTNHLDTLLLDIIPISLGIETMGGVVEKIIPRNSPIPISMAQDFTTYQNNQTAISFHVLQGEREFVNDCRSLAKFELHNIPPMLAGAARVRVTFSIDVDGLLTVTAKESTTGIAQEVIVKPTYGLNTEDYMHMLSDAYSHAEEDMNQRLLASAVMKSQQILSQLENALLEDSHLLNESEIQDLTTRATNLRNALDITDKDRITKLCEELMHASQIFAERRLTHAIKNKLNLKIPN